MLRYCAHSHAALPWYLFIHPSIDVGLAVAAGYFLGTQGSNECPPGGSTQFISGSTGSDMIESDCATAAGELGQPFQESVERSDWPKWCIFKHTGLAGGVYFNTHWAGTANNDFQMVCFGACSGPRPFVYVRVSVHAACIYRCTSGIPPS